MKSIIKNIIRSVFVVFIFTILLSVNTYAAGWTAQIGSGQLGWTSITSSQDGLKIFAITSNLDGSNDLYSSIDGGINWVKKQSASNFRKIVASSDATRLIVVGNDGNIYLSTNNADSWTKLTSIYSFSKIVMSDDGMNLAAINNDGYIYTSIDGGATWIKRDSVFIDTQSSIASSADGMKLISVPNPNKGYIKISIDGGITWTESTTTPWSGNWESVASSADGSILYAILSHDFGGGTSLYKSTDGGINWTIINTGSINIQYILSSADSQKLVAIARDSYIYISTDGGQNWTNTINRKGWSDIFLTDDGNKIIASGDYIYTYNDVVTNPIVYQDPASVIDYISLGFSGNVNTEVFERGFEWCDGGTNYFSNNCTYNASTSEIGTFTLGNFTATATNLTNNHFYHYRVFATNASSTTYSEDNLILLNYQIWTPQEQRPGNWQSLEINASGTKLMGIINNSKRYCTYDSYNSISLDTGVAWESGTPCTSEIASSADGMNLAAAGYGYIYTSIDGGVTWIEQIGSGQRYWSSIASSADGIRLAATVNGGYIYTSIDGGVNWIEQIGSGQRSWISIASSADGMNLATINNDGYIYTSIDGGVTWIEQIGSGQRSWQSIASSADGMKLVATVYDGYIYTSTDGGVTWIEQTGSGRGIWSSIASSADGIKLVVTKEFEVDINGDYTTGYIYTSIDGGVNWRKELGAGKGRWTLVTSSASGETMAAFDRISYKVYTRYNSIPKAENVVVDEQ